MRGGQLDELDTSVPSEDQLAITRITKERASHVTLRSGPDEIGTLADPLMTATASRSFDADALATNQQTRVTMQDRRGAGLRTLDRRGGLGRGMMR